MREKVFIALGIIMALALFWAGADPAAGEVFPGGWHSLAHLAAFAMLGSFWTLGLPKRPASYVALAIVAFGFLHEAYEMIGHAHAFELVDALVDALGSVLGVSMARLARKIAG